MTPPEDLKTDFGLNTTASLEPNTAFNRYVFARSLTAMREAMNKDVQARLVMGGKLQGFQGKYPGLVEEAYLALKEGKPLFLIGAFGGAANAVIKLLKGEVPETLTEAFQMRDENHAGMVEEYNREAAAKPHLHLEPIDYNSLTDFFRSKGIAGVANGLNEAENRRLFESTDLDEIISLILKGLANLHI